MTATTPLRLADLELDSLLYHGRSHLSELPPCGIYGATRVDGAVSWLFVTDDGLVVDPPKWHCPGVHQGGRNQRPSPRGKDTRGDCAHCGTEFTLLHSDKGWWVVPQHFID